MLTAGNWQHRWAHWYYFNHRAARLRHGGSALSRASLAHAPWGAALVEVRLGSRTAVAATPARDSFRQLSRPAANGLTARTTFRETVLDHRRQNQASNPGLAAAGDAGVHLSIRRPVAHDLWFEDGQPGAVVFDGELPVSGGCQSFWRQRSAIVPATTALTCWVDQAGIPIVGTRGQREHQSNRGCED